ncbi:MAG TPA: HAD hydrolase-like protein [Streptosporangiaceae bacterium]|jgi:phosphoglycolate phosphatase
MCGPAPGAVIFDLDGTLVHTRLASWEAFRPVSRQFELGVDTAEQFYELFQDNFFRGLRALCGDERRATQVEHAFLDALRRDYAPPMIPGMADVVKALAPRSTLAVLSSNATAVIRRILLDNDVAYCFAHVFGGDVEPDKRQGIQRFLTDAAGGAGRRCEASYDESRQGGTASRDSTTLVTDTVGDIAAAKASGIRAVGVAWGMHSEKELLDAGADFVAIWPQELLAVLAGDGPAEACCTGCQGGDPTSRPGGRTAAPAIRTELDKAATIRRDRRRHPPEAPARGPGPGDGVAAEPRDRPADQELLAAVRRIIR